MVTKNTIAKLRKKAGEEFIPIGEQLRAEGMNDVTILIAFENYKKAKTNQFYNRQERNLPMHVAGTLQRILYDGPPDSDAETILIKMLQQNSIPYEFQYKIGTYRVDFLIDGIIVLECDGPQHIIQRQEDQRRDKYFEGLGYYVLRISWDLLSQIPDIFIEELRSLIPELKKPGSGM